MAREVDKHPSAAGIAKWTLQGKFDFHAFRTTFDSLVLETGATVREAMDVMRHESSHLTLSTYGRSRERRLHEVAETVGEKVLSGSVGLSAIEAGTTPTLNGTTLAQWATPLRAAGAERLSVDASKTPACHDATFAQQRLAAEPKKVEAAGIEPAKTGNGEVSDSGRGGEDLGHRASNLGQGQGVGEMGGVESGSNPGQTGEDLGHSGSTTWEQWIGEDEGLREIVGIWRGLSGEAREAVLGVARALVGVEPRRWPGQTI